MNLNPWKTIRALRKELAEQKAAHAKILRGRLPHPKTPKLRELFTDSQGRTYYEYADLLDLPIIRKVEADRLALSMNSSLTPEIAKRMWLRGKELFEAGEIGEFYKVFTNMVELAHLSHYSEMVLELAGVYYLREDEDPLTYDRELVKEKMAYWASDPDCMAFFLPQAFRSTWNSQNESNESILKRLAEAEQRKDEILKRSAV